MNCRKLLQDLHEDSEYPVIDFGICGCETSSVAGGQFFLFLCV